MRSVVYTEYKSRLVYHEHCIPPPLIATPCIERQKISLLKFSAHIRCWCYKAHCVCYCAPPALCCVLPVPSHWGPFLLARVKVFLCTHTHCFLEGIYTGMIVSVLLSLLLWSLVEVHSQTSTPYISFRGQNLSNNSYVEFSRVGAELNGSDSVRCRTELEMCCSGTQGDLRGDWFFPSGERLPFPRDGDPFEGRGAQTVDLRRISALSPSGLYRCNIAFDADNPSAMQTFYVGIYNNGGTLFIACVRKNCITHSYR